MTCGIYKITNTKNNKFYIGSSTNIERRIYSHFLKLKKAITVVSEKVDDDPNYFSRLSNLQTPEFLWIGCSDSRVPANEITGTEPGEIFVQRNIANMVIHTDLNLLSVLQYAVEVLEVKHIIVCGHYGCGGVKAAMGNHSLGIINKWLRNIKDVYRIHQDELEAITDEGDRVNRLVELNVQEQVMNLAKTSIIQSAWKHKKQPDIHGWVDVS